MEFLLYFLPEFYIAARRMNFLFDSLFKVYERYSIFSYPISYQKYFKIFVLNVNYIIKLEEERKERVILKVGTLACLQAGLTIERQTLKRNDPNLACAKVANTWCRLNDPMTDPGSIYGLAKNESRATIHEVRRGKTRQRNQRRGTNGRCRHRTRRLT